MSFNPARFSPVVRTIRTIAFENGPLYRPMLAAFGDNQKMRIFMDAWFKNGTKWDGTTTLHKFVEQMPQASFPAFKAVVADQDEDLSEQCGWASSTISNKFTPIIFHCSQIRDPDGNTPLAIAIKSKKWPLAEYLQNFDSESGYELAIVYLKNIAFRTLSPSQDEPNQFKLAINFIRNHVSDEDWKKGDKHGWTIAHHLAFKGIPQKFFKPTQQSHWEKGDNKGITPNQIAELIAFLADEQTHPKPSDLKQQLAQFPKSRAEELTETVVERNRMLMNKIYSGLSIIPESASYTQFTEMYDNLFRP